MLASDSTIAAIATPPGEGGVGIVRLSGPRSLAIAQALSGAMRGASAVRSHRMVHGTILDPGSGALIDECLVCYMAGPRSYTGENVVEFHCHGSPVVLERVLACCLAQGAELANRGEFTLRALLNGRLNLAQAEAVIDLVRARTPTAAQVAAQGVTGALAKRLEPVITSLTGTLAYLEATIDFVEEGLPERAAPRLLDEVTAAEASIAALLSRAHHGAVLRDGVRVVLAGKPNVGKSSVLNALLRRDRAIVTPIAGTTRDTLEEMADIHGVPMYLIDTAGLTETDDQVERIGVERSLAALQSANIVLLVVDVSTAIDQTDRDAARLVAREARYARVVLVGNKVDLARETDTYLADLALTAATASSRHVVCSAQSGLGLDDLEDALVEAALGGQTLCAEDTLVENVRQAAALREAATALAAAHTGLAGSRLPELVCIDIRNALESLGAISGTNVGEAVLTAFSAISVLGSRAVPRTAAARHAQGSAQQNAGEQQQRRR